jgi:hypothetical protein
MNSVESLRLIFEKDIVENHFFSTLTNKDLLSLYLSYVIDFKRLSLLLSKRLNKKLDYLFTEVGISVNINELKQLMHVHKVSLSGSFVLSAILDEYYDDGDIDFYLDYNSAAIVDVLKFLQSLGIKIQINRNTYKDLSGIECIISGYHKVINKDISFIFINKDFFQFINNFDLSIVKNICTYCPKSDTFKFRIFDIDRIYSGKMKLLVEMDNIKIIRVKKYIDRGFMIDSDDDNINFTVMEGLMCKHPTEELGVYFHRRRYVNRGVIHGETFKYKSRQLIPILDKNPLNGLRVNCDDRCCVWKSFVKDYKHVHIVPKNIVDQYSERNSTASYVYSVTDMIQIDLKESNIIILNS